MSEKADKIKFLRDSLKISEEQANQIYQESLNAPILLFSDRAFNEARYHFKAFEALFKATKQDETANYAPSMIMTLSFSLELMFKCLVAIDLNVVNKSDIKDKQKLQELAGHVIPKLFDNIKQNYKEQLAKIYAHFTNQQQLSVASFREMIVERANEIFKIARYGFEESIAASYNIPFMLDVHNSIEALITMIKISKNGDATKEVSFKEIADPRVKK